MFCLLLTSDNTAEFQKVKKKMSSTAQVTEAKPPGFFDFGNSEEAPQSEVDEYLASRDKELSCLDRFPTIRQIYIKYNTILSSSASPERLFSKGKLTFQTKRHRLLNENFEKQLLLNCNSHFYRAFNK